MEEWGPVSHLRMRDPLEEEKKEALVLEKWLWLCKIPSCISRGVLMMLHPRSADEKKPVYTRRVVSILASLDWEDTSHRIRGGSDVLAVQGGSL